MATIILTVGNAEDLLGKLLRPTEVSCTQALQVPRVPLCRSPARWDLLP